MLAAPAAPPRGNGESVCPIVNTHTTCMLGVFTVKVGAKLMATMTILDGVMSVLTWLIDHRNPDSVMFRWGPHGWEALLQTMNTLVGISSILVGVAALRFCDELDLRGMHRFRNYLLFAMIWTVMWFMFVGVPVDVVYISTPVVPAWPVSAVPGMPHQEVIDPAWPHGRPSVCTDVQEAKNVLATLLTKKRKNRALGKILNKVYHRVFRKIVKCHQVQKIFWILMLVSLSWRLYAVHLIEYFYKVVRHGGDGAMMIGHLSDLEKPVTTTTRELIERQMEGIFAEIDKDGDGRVSLDELMGYLKRSSTLYAGGSKPDDDTEGMKGISMKGIGL